MKLVTVISFMVFTFCVAEKPVDYRLALADACTPRACTTPGPLCETCTNLVGCVLLDNGTYEKNPLATCKTPSYCVNETCTSDYDPFCSGVTDISFACHDVGVFPDPFYHSKFVFCYKDGANFKSILSTCEDGYSFNIANDLCSEIVANAECPDQPYPVPFCEAVGQSGAIPEKPAMYYICEERTYGTNETALYPDLYLCTGGLPYVDFQCGGSQNITTPTSTTT